MKKKTLIILAFIILVILIFIVVMFFMMKKSPDFDYYKNVAQLYQDQGIDYDRDDFENNNGDKSSELANNNNNKLNSEEGHTLIKADTKKIAKDILSQTTTMNNFIKIHAGYDDKNYPNSSYENVKLYVDLLIKSMSNSNTDITNIYPDLPLDDQRSALRYSISENVQYRVGSPTTLYKQNLYNYMKIGHPILDIDPNYISLSTKSNKDFDNIYTSNLQATVVTKDKKNVYLIYLVSSIDDKNNGTFKILDVEKK